MMVKPSKDILSKIYWDDRLSLREIGKRFGVCPTTIREWMEIYHIPRRGKMEALKEKLVRDNPSRRPDVRKRKSLKMSEYCSRLEVKERRSLQMAGERNPMYRKAPWNRGKPRSEECKRKISETRKRLYKRGVLKPFYGGENPVERAGVREKISKFMRELYQKHPEKREELSQAAKKRWYKKEYREKTIRSLLRRLRERPTSLEKRFMQIMEKYVLPYRYVGDGSFLIGGRNPDFVNYDGGKICVEVANHYHHQGNWAEKRIRHFSEWGWTCIVFFEDEMEKDDIIVARLKEIG
jgi:hypothetical protein